MAMVNAQGARPMAAHPLAAGRPHPAHRAPEQHGPRHRRRVGGADGAAVPGERAVRGARRVPAHRGGSGARPRTLRGGERLDAPPATTAPVSAISFERRHTGATPSISIKKSGWNRLLTTIKVLAGSSPYVSGQSNRPPSIRVPIL